LNYSLHLLSLVPNLPHELEAVSAWLGIAHLPLLISRFLYRQEQKELESNSEHDGDIPIPALPQYMGKVYIYPSAASTYFAPSDKSGLRVEFESPVGSGFWALFGATGTATGFHKRKFFKNRTATAKDRKNSPKPELQPVLTGRNR